MNISLGEFLTFLSYFGGVAGIVGGLVTWQRNSATAKVNDSRDMGHLKRNYETLSSAYVELNDDQEKQFADLKIYLQEKFGDVNLALREISLTLNYLSTPVRTELRLEEPTRHDE